MSRLEKLQEFIGEEMTILELTNKIEALGTTECLRGTSLEEVFEEGSFGVNWDDDEWVFFFEPIGELNGWETKVILNSVM